MFSLGKNDRIKDKRFSAVCHARSPCKRRHEARSPSFTGKGCQEDGLTDRLANSIDCKGSNGGFERASRTNAKFHSGVVLKRGVCPCGRIE